MSATQADTTEPNPFNNLTGFRRDLIEAIEHVQENGTPRDADLYEYDKPTGQCIKERVEQTGYGVINHGRLYPNLDALVETGLVEKEAGPDRRTNYYVLSPAGEQAVAQYKEFVGACV